jgi:hypothetical protein
MSILGRPDLGSVDGLPVAESRYKFDTVIINGQAERMHKIIAHEFEIAALEDPVIEAGPELYKWEKSEQGQWVMAHALETPIWHKHEDMATYLVRFIITAKLRGRDYTFWTMKWGSPKSR